MRPISGPIFVVAAGIGAVGCSGSGSSSGGSQGVGGTSNALATGGVVQTGGATSSGVATGGSLSLGGTTARLQATGGSPGGGATATSVSLTGGSRPTGGAPATGGTRAATGGAPTTGGSSMGAATGGAPNAGGVSAGTATGGAPNTGGVSAGTATGGAPNTGGASAGAAAGGTTAAGGSSIKGGTSSTGGTSASGSGSDAKPSTGCGKTPTLKNSPTSTANQNTLTISGTSRQFVMRWPTNYDSTHPYRLILDFHGAGGKDTDLAPSYFGLFDLSNNSTIFIAPSANGGYWDATADLTFVDQILTAVEADLCIDMSRVQLEGFSQGGAMIATLACQRPGVFRAAVGHSRGGLTAPSTCQPIPYLGSLGLSDISGNSQATQTDPFAKWNGCTVTTMPLASTGSHVCTNYTNCPQADPVIFCSFDGPHTPSPTDSGKSTSWMPQEVWTFLSGF